MIFELLDKGCLLIFQGAWPKIVNNWVKIFSSACLSAQTTFKHSSIRQIWQKLIVYWIRIFFTQKMFLGKSSINCDITFSPAHSGTDFPQESLRIHLLNFFIMPLSLFCTSMKSDWKIMIFYWMVLYHRIQEINH